MYRRYMVNAIISLAGPALQFAILCRGFWVGLLRRYPIFYSYLGFVFLVDIIRYTALHVIPGDYKAAYWATQFPTLIVGYGVLLEIAGKTLQPYAGADRIVRKFIWALFIAVFLFVGFQSKTVAHWSPAATYGELERDIRAVEVLVLVGALAIIRYYGISLGKNMRGIIQGYGLFLAVSVVSPALRSYAGASMDLVWQHAQSYSYLASLAIWLNALWNYDPNPRPEEPGPTGSDYKPNALKTKALLEEMRSYVGRTARP